MQVEKNLNIFYSSLYVSFIKNLWKAYLEPQSNLLSLMGHFTIKEANCLVLIKTPLPHYNMEPPSRTRGLLLGDTHDA